MGWEVCFEVMVSPENWAGVFPAMTTQFFEDQTLDLEGTVKSMMRMREVQVDGLVVLGSLGENNGLGQAEKLAVVRAAKSVAGHEIPVVSGVSELNTAAAIDYVREAKMAGADGFMVLPCMAYHSDPGETMAHYRAVAKAADAPIIIYNNPVAYKVDITPAMLDELADEENFVAVKESSGDTRRITDITNQVGNRYTLFAGVDPLVYECVALGATGWIAGIGLAFPEENQLLWGLMTEGRWAEALDVYRWFVPLAHLDVGNKFVQKIKLAMQETGEGTEWVRQPRLPLTGAERDDVLQIVRHGIANRPVVKA